MKGWEAAVYPSISDYQSITASQWSALLDLAVAELGITRTQLSISPDVEGPIGAENHIVNDNADPNVINPAGFNWLTFDWQIDHLIVPFRQKVLASGQQPYISLQYAQFEPSSTFEHYQNPQEYAEFMLAVFQHMKTKYGFVPNAIEVIHEPDRLTGWTPARIGAVMVGTAQRLQSNGFSVPEFIAPSTSSMSAAAAYIDGILAVPGAAAYMTEFAYHRYGGQSLADLQAIAQRAVQHGKRTAMVEFSGDRRTQNSGPNYRMLHQDLTTGRNSAWQQGPFADAFGCVNQWMRVVNGVPELCANSKLTRQYTKYVRPGAQRIDATSQNPAFEPVAFVNSDGKYVVVINAGGTGSFAVTGLPPGTYGIFYSTATQYNVNVSNVTLTTGQTLSTSMPAVGVITIYQR
jgi:O-glycosyl hydrolase